MASRAQQQQFQGSAFKKQVCFGGKLLKGNPKTRRPLDSKLPVHLVLRGTKGGMRLPATYRKVNQVMLKTTAKYGVKVYEYANVGNHPHLVIRVTKLVCWAGFIRELSGRIGLLIKRQLQMSKEESYWLYRPFTRVVSGWRKAFKTIKEYVYLNQLEAEGFVSRKDTKTLKDLRAIFGDG